MRVVPFAEDAFPVDHPRAMVAFNYPLMGESPSRGDHPLHSGPSGGRLLRLGTGRVSSRSGSR
jgi:hypothetical protein